MQVFVNGEAKILPADAPLSDLLQSLHLSGKRIAVERNGEIVPRSAYATTTLADGDRLEIVQAIGGG